MDKPEEKVDEFHGMGGSYLVDPETGKRVLVERTQEAEAVPPSDVGLASGKSAS